MDLLKIAQQIPNAKIITIHVKKGEAELEVPAVSQDNVCFRIPHKVLIEIFRMREAKDHLSLESGVIDGVVVINSSPGYCLTACRLVEDGFPHPVFFGEHKAGISKNSAEKNYPFSIALNRAQDKAILEWLGLPSQVFNQDGMPLFYGAADATNDEFDEKAPAVPEELTPDEKSAMDTLGKQQIGMRGNDGKVIMVSLSQLTPKRLAQCAALTDASHLPIAHAAKEYLDLQAKKTRREEYMLAQKGGRH